MGSIRTGKIVCINYNLLCHYVLELPSPRHNILLSMYKYPFKYKIRKIKHTFK